MLRRQSSQKEFHLMCEEATTEGDEEWLRLEGNKRTVSGSGDLESRAGTDHT